jgi:hypothetical protein
VEVIMKSFHEASEKIEWHRPDPQKAEYLFKHGAEILGRLTWDRAGGHAESAAGTWTFEKHGFMNPHIVVRDKAGAKLARFDATMGGGGVLEAPDGRHIKWVAHPWQADWHWVSVAEKELVSFRFLGFAVDGSPEGTIVVHEHAKSSPHLPLAVLLGCYVIHLVAESPA